MKRYFEDFAINAIMYRPCYIELVKGGNTYRARDAEALLVFQRQGWVPIMVVYVRLFGGHVDTGKEYALPFSEFEAVRLNG
jgi:hypothetical protein